MNRLIFKTVVSEVIDDVETGKWIRVNRKKRGLTLQQASERMGISVAYLSALERGERKWSSDLIDRWDNAV